MSISPSFTNSNDAENIPAFPVLTIFFLFIKILGIISVIFFHVDKFAIKFLITRIPSSVVNTGNLGIVIF